MKTTFLLTLALAVQAAAAPSSNPLEQLASYDYGQDTTAIFNLETTLRGQSPAERAAYEPKILALLAATGTSVAAKQELIRCLLLTDTAAAAPALEKLAATNVLAADVARALAGITDPAADLVLLRLATTATDANCTTFINALGQRRSTVALNALIRIAAKSESSTQAEAAIEAIARIGTPDALMALTTLPLNGPQTEARTRALLATADTVIRRSSAAQTTANRKAAAKVARSVLATTKLVPSRIEAAQILLVAAGKSAVAELLPLTRDPILRVRQSVARNLTLSCLPAALTDLNAAFSSLLPDTQGAIVSAASDAGSSQMMPLLKTALATGDATIQPIAARAAGRCGDETTVDLLIPLLNAAPDLAAAKAGLTFLPSGKTDLMLLAKLEHAETPVAKISILTILTDRQQHAAFPAAIALCAQSDATWRASAFESVTKLARTEDFPLILTLTSKIQKSADRNEWRKALLATAAMQPNDGKAVTLVQAALDKTEAPERTILLGALTVLPGDESTKTLRSMLASPDVEVRKDIIRALAAARSDGAYTLLKETAEKSTDPTEQILALRGYLDTLAALNNLKPAQRIADYRAAWPLASRQEEKDAILAAVKQIKGKEADKFIEEFSPPEAKPAAKT